MNHLLYILRNQISHLITHYISPLLATLHTWKHSSFLHFLLRYIIKVYLVYLLNLFRKCRNKRIFNIFYKFIFNFTFPIFYPFIFLARSKFLFHKLIIHSSIERTNLFFLRQKTINIIFFITRIFLIITTYSLVYPIKFLCLFHIWNNNNNQYWSQILFSKNNSHKLQLMTFFKWYEFCYLYRLKDWLIFNISYWVLFNSNKDYVDDITCIR